jgi:hypothetical protein
MAKDLVIRCEDCGQEFPWTEDEQRFYEQRSLKPPEYCLICRGKYGAAERDMSHYRKK